MRFAKVPLLCLLAVFALVPMVSADNCDGLENSLTDTVRLPYFFCGQPGDTILLPVMMNQDSTVVSFQFLIKFDTTWLTPITYIDSVYNVDELSWTKTNYVRYLITGRMLITDTTEGEFGPVIDTINGFQINFYQDRKDVLACNMLPEDYENMDSIPPGSDTIFYVKMKVKDNMPQGTLSYFTFLKETLIWIDSSASFPYPEYEIGCSMSQMATAWYKGKRTDGVTDSVVNYLVYPTTTGAYTYKFQCDTACAPPVIANPTVALTANPTSITTSGSSSLSWISTNSDSVVVRTSGGTRMTGTQNGSTSGVLTFVPTGTGTFTFVATAYGTNGTTVADDASVVVSTGGGSATAPTLSVAGLASEYEAGDEVSFTVTATSTTSSASNVTLSASNLPSGATFGTSGSVTGSSPVTGTLEWTPTSSQVGYFTITFTGLQDGQSNNLAVSVHVKEVQFDRLYSTSKSGSRPVGGRPGKAEVAFPIDLKKIQDIYGIQFDMTYPDDFLRVDSFMTTARIPEYVVYDNIGSTPGNIRVVTFGLNNEAVADTNTTAIMYAMMTIDSSAAPWTDLVIHLLNGRESIDPDPLVGSVALLTDSGLVVVDSLGDVNLDRYIDVADVVNIVSSIIGTFTLPQRQFEVADLITNDSVNVFDLVADVNMIYGIALPQPAPPAPDQVAVVTVTYAEMTGGSSDVLKVSSEIPEAVAGVQLQLNYDASAVSLGTPRLTSDNADYALNSYDNGQGRMRIVLYKFAPASSDDFMQAGPVDLVEIPITAYQSLKSDDKTKIRLTEALMSTTVAGAITVEGIDRALPATFTLRQNYPNPFNPTTIIEFEVGVSDVGALQQDVSLDVFNVLGQQVTTLINGNYAAGAYKVTWDATDKRGQRVASGVYLYRLRVGNESLTKKMLFLK